MCAHGKSWAGRWPAYAGGRTAGNAIFHSDRGSQYTSRQFRKISAELDIRQSVGRTGSCFA
ncbi:DDE-type integrase/transposase/recombinase [Streptomyces sp. NBC_01450]|uniref:DDE-type integrase/transposase/recombinase n=1 Tax=Streptomyces sp. NBC_01450 TaxID=2903871 RepID=UPI003FCD8461